MFLAFLTFLSGLAISAIAIYYSVSGLVSIFAAAAVPIMIMGTVLELSKLVAAWWLKANWEKAPFALKSYMLVAVLVLMFITSMGIFGFLSKAHIEQTSMSQEQVAQIDTINEKITRSEAKITRWQDEIDALMKGGGSRVDSMAANDQAELDKIYARIKEEKSVLQETADKQIAQQNARLEQAQERKEADIKAATERFKGSLAGGTEYDKAVEQAKKTELGVASAAQREIGRINRTLNSGLAAVDKKYATQIKDIQDRIAKLRTQASTKTEDVDVRINQLEKSIKEEQTGIDTVREDKLVFEKEFRKLEAEVGPIKYIAEFIYGEQADKNILEKAVTWMIIIIIFVFDPLAVLLLLASQMSFGWLREEKDQKENEFLGWDDEWKGQDAPDVYAFENTEPPTEEEKEEIAKEETSTVPVKGDSTTPGWMYQNRSHLRRPEQSTAPPEDPVIVKTKKKPKTEIKIVDEDTIQYGNIKVNRIGDRYFDVGGKKMSAEVFASEYPELSAYFKPVAPVSAASTHPANQQSKIQADNVAKPVSTSFGTHFPEQAEKGQMFLRVDSIPNRLYKFNGSKWIEVDKTRSDTYSYDEQYIQFLIEKLASGEYDLDQLSASEQELVAEQLERKNGKT